MRFPTIWFVRAANLRLACAHAHSDQSLCLSLDYSTIVELLTDYHLEFLSLKGGCTGSSEYARVKMPHCWKSHFVAHMFMRLSRDACMLYSHISCYFNLSMF